MDRLSLASEVLAPLSVFFYESQASKIVRKEGMMEGKNKVEKIRGENELHSLRVSGKACKGQAGGRMKEIKRVCCRR